MRRPFGTGPLRGLDLFHDPWNVNAGPTTAHLSEALRAKAERMAAAARRNEQPQRPAEPKQTEAEAEDDR